jgi:ATP-binding cassette subfamily B protein
MLFRDGDKVVPASRGTRALLSGAPILLLDEATSALDDRTEAKLLENISKMRDKTCIIVTHRAAALSICDYTLHIEEGTMSQKA